VKILLIVLALLVILVVAAVVWMGMPKGPSLDEVAHLKTPQIFTMEAQPVLQVRAKGDPNQVGKAAFGLLMKTYFKLKGVPKGGPSMKAPRARWQIEPGIAMEDWEGLYALPVPESVTNLPVMEPQEGLTVELTTWEYGEVAQMLHVGRWDQETANIEALHGFIRSQGYQITGLHEEEYLKGPGFLLAGNPDKYLTLIRYQVRRIHAP
jgi:effector-binding domain-containing protein